MTDNEGYVIEYVIVTPDGRERRWRQERCGFLKDDLENMWHASGGAGHLRSRSLKASSPQYIEALD
jgi:hypothetical protein